MTKNNLILLAILLLALGVRFYKLDAFAPYMDEKFTLLTSNGICVGGNNQREVFFQKKYFTPAEFWKEKHYADYSEAIARAEIGAHLPYNFLLNGWSKIWGLNDFSLRFLSALLGFLTVILLYFFVKDILGSTQLALIASFLAAIEPMFLALNHMIRSYSLSIFLTLASTYLFFKLLRAKDDRKVILWYILYFALTATALLTHFLNGMVLLIQGLYILFFVRNWSKWISFGIVGSLATAVLLSWFKFGAGQWTFQFMNDKNALHSRMAKMPPALNPMNGTVDFPSAHNIYVHLMDVISDLFITTNGVYREVSGNKNFLLFVIITSLTLIVYKKATEKYKYWAMYGVSLLGFVLYSQNRIAFLILEANVVMLFLYFFDKPAQTNTNKFKHNFVLFLLLFCLIPQLYLCVDALKSGHTGNITQRYEAFAMPYILIFVAILIDNMLNYSNKIKIPLLLIFALQLFNVAKLDAKILEDSAGKYTYFETPRTKNPYKIAADNIMKFYAKGDTIVYPSNLESAYSKVLKDDVSFSIADAQYTNVYLPKDSQMLERIEPSEPNKIILKKANGQEILIFDFEGRKYRY